MALSSKFVINGIEYEVLDANTKAALNSLIAGTTSTGSVDVPGETYWVPTSTYRSAIDALLGTGNVIKLQGVLTVASGSTVADTLAAVSNPTVGDLYLILNADETSPSQYEEWVYVASLTWEKLGVSKADIDISGKADKTEVVAGINAFVAAPQWDTTAADPTAEPNYGIYTIKFPVASINSSTGAIEYTYPTI